ncbi:MAG: hypothetical protein M1831_000433 [Alyxoria varia]|nr:MAG: hypothetical protein M1831_000433 [Alyxoria varia]
MAGDEKEEEDYMNMTFAEEPAAPKFESSIQKQARKRREAEIKARVKSKKEIEEDERKAREERLAISMMTDKSNKGLKLIEKLGFKGGSLGKRDRDANEGTDASKGPGRFDPITVELKDDRGGIGADAVKKRKVREAMEKETQGPKADEGEYRERVAREKMDRKLEGQLKKAMKVAEGLDEDEEQNTQESSDEKKGEEVLAGTAAHLAELKESSPQVDGSKTAPKAKQKRLKDVNILYRALAKQRLESNWHHHQKQELYKRLESSSSRLPTYIDSDEQDPDYKLAFGKDEQLQKDEADNLELENLDEEDKELEQFNALPLEERLMKLVKYMRGKFWYCFWCKTKFEDESMEGCPGLTEDDHD